MLILRPGELLEMQEPANAIDGNASELAVPGMREVGTYIV
jgi:hypothetical protein